MFNKFSILLFLLGYSYLSSAEEFQRFDGQYYNNLYYPRIDIVSWGEPLHLEFQIYDKKNQIDIGGITLDKGGQAIYLVAFDLTYRGERRCRRVVAPPNFKVGQELYYYYDNSDKDMNNIIVSAKPIAGKKKYEPKQFSNCVEVAANSQDTPSKDVRRVRIPASQKGPRTVFDQNKERKNNSQYNYQPIDSSFDWFTDRKQSNRSSSSVKSTKKPNKEEEKSRQLDRPAANNFDFFSDSKPK